jgi:Domain of unknown function (DUF4270)
MINTKPEQFFSMKKKILPYIILLTLLTGCIKTPVDFNDNSNTNDPNVVYYDNYPVELSTYKTDSFLTSGHTVFTVGYHSDPLLGKINAASYTELQLPSENPLKNQNVTFDSLVVLLKPNGNYYGDTSLPVHLTVHRLIENIKNEEDDNNRFFTPRKFATETLPIGKKTVIIRPLKDTLISIRLPDAIGLDLFQKLKSNATEIQSNANFIKYFRGFRIGTDSLLTNTLFYLIPHSGATVMRLHYRLNGTVSAEKELNFYLNPQKQFNNINTNHQSGIYATFNPLKRQLKSSSIMGNKAYLNSNAGCYIKISFPNLLTLKELYPYVNILKAELVVKPSPGSYTYPYELPPVLNLSVTDDDNRPLQTVADPNGQSLTGNLTIDNLYGVDTKYSYDITSFIKSLIEAGRFSKSALLLLPASAFSDGSLSRLVVNNQQLGNSIQLKLYVLGL